MMRRAPLGTWEPGKACQPGEATAGRYGPTLGRVGAWGMVRPPALRLSATCATPRAATPLAAMMSP